MWLKKVRQFFKYIVVDLLLAALISFILINYIISAFRIEGDSMSPLLSDQDRVFVSKLNIRVGKIERFNIVVLGKIDDSKKTIIKRIIGLPGEIIEIRRGDVFINYRKLDQPFLRSSSPPDGGVFNQKPLLIPKDHYFVMGDNRPRSRDSRSFGTVSITKILGKVFFRYWPLSRLGKVERD